LWGGETLKGYIGTNNSEMLDCGGVKSNAKK